MDEIYHGGEDKWLRKATFPPFIEDLYQSVGTILPGKVKTKAVLKNYYFHEYTQISHIIRTTCPILFWFVSCCQKKLRPVRT